ncbi:Wzz/FepE/Etk N-terminal domain-containing protein [Paeniglutamicibacter antarcticus]|uniref:Polysaccharide chain length determinant N-terminal domain-containing protein n=1 Tax=Paeniglutamicibacter antarcticus TaxID=494023 RepID=A0ABP9TM89_9MICC
MSKGLEYRDPRVLPNTDYSTRSAVGGPKSEGVRIRTMDLREYLNLLRDRKIWIIVATILGVATSAWITLNMTPVYRAEATLFITVQSSQDTAYARSQYAMQRVGSYPRLISDPKILDEVIQKLDLDIGFQELTSSLKASNPADTVLVVVSASASTAKEAADIANTAAPLLADQISGLENSEPKKLLVSAELSVPAIEPIDPISPRKTVNLALGFIAGLSWGLILALVVDKIDPRVLRARDAERQTKLRVLGTVHGKNDKRRNAKRGNGYRQLVSNLLLANDGHLPQRILVLSEKETTIDPTELAGTFAAIGKKAVVIEGDKHLEGLDQEAIIGPGLSQVLDGQATLQEAVRDMNHVPMGYLPVGASDTGLRRYDVFRKLEPLIAELEVGYDVVVILTTMETDPVDGAAVAMHCDCVLLTCRERRTTFHHLRRIVDDLSAVRVGATGLVILHKPHRLVQPLKE